jgi:hypothetical protein
MERLLGLRLRGHSVGEHALVGRRGLLTFSELPPPSNVRVGFVLDVRVGRDVPIHAVVFLPGVDGRNDVIELSVPLYDQFVVEQQTVPLEELPEVVRHLLYPSAVRSPARADPPAAALRTASARRTAATRLRATHRLGVPVRATPSGLPLPLVAASRATTSFGPVQQRELAGLFATVTLENATAVEYRMAYRESNAYVARQYASFDRLFCVGVAAALRAVVQTGQVSLGSLLVGTFTKTVYVDNLDVQLFDDLFWGPARAASSSHTNCARASSRAMVHSAFPPASPY